MSEKRKIQRFNLDEGRIWEMIEGLSPFKTTYTLEEVCEKLNEQQDTIEQLNLAIDDLLSHTSCDEIKKENEQLKKEYKIAIDEMVTDYKKLEKENEMLRILLKNVYVDDELRKLAERYGVENE